jgi:hypothetical protein
MGVRKGEESKKRIIDAAEKLFSEKGYQATSVQDVLDALSISKGGFYHYFETKMDLLAAVCTRRARPASSTPTRSATTRARPSTSIAERTAIGRSSSTSPIPRRTGRCTPTTTTSRVTAAASTPAGTRCARRAWTDWWRAES